MKKLIIYLLTAATCFANSFEFTQGNFISSSKGRPDIEYDQVNARIQLQNKGKKSKLLELTYSDVNGGPGNYMAGVVGILRHNFTKKLYFQGGLGLLVNDIFEAEYFPERHHSKKVEQDNIGGRFEATIRLGAGLEILNCKDISFGVEALGEHVSNSGTAERNEGMNAYSLCIKGKYRF